MSDPINSRLGSGPNLNPFNDFEPPYEPDSTQPVQEAAFGVLGHLPNFGGFGNRHRTFSRLAGSLSDPARESETFTTEILRAPSLPPVPTPFFSSPPSSDLPAPFAQISFDIEEALEALCGSSSSSQAAPIVDIPQCSGRLHSNSQAEAVKPSHRLGDQPSSSARPEESGTGEKAAQARLPVSSTGIVPFPKELTDQQKIKKRYREELSESAKALGLNPTEEQLNQVMKWAAEKATKKSQWNPNRKTQALRENPLLVILQKDNQDWYQRFFSDWVSVSQRQRFGKPLHNISIKPPFTLEGWKELLEKLEGNGFQDLEKEECEKICKALAAAERKFRECLEQEEIDVESLKQEFRTRLKLIDFQLDPKERAVVEQFIEEHFQKKMEAHKSRKKRKELSSTTTHSPRSAKKMKTTNGDSD